MVCRGPIRTSSRSTFRVTNTTGPYPRLKVDTTASGAVGQAGGVLHSRGLDHAEPDAVGSPGAVVLRDERRHGKAERCEQCDGELVDSRGGRVSGDGVGTEAVEPHLHGERTDRDDRRLEPHGEAEPQVAGEVAAGLSLIHI